jgi:hypothetical protein
VVVGKSGIMETFKGRMAIVGCDARLSILLVISVYTSVVIARMVVMISVSNEMLLETQSLTSFVSRLGVSAGISGNFSLYGNL